MDMYEHVLMDLGLQGYAARRESRSDTRDLRDSRSARRDSRSEHADAPRAESDHHRHLVRQAVDLEGRLGEGLGPLGEQLDAHLASRHVDDQAEPAAGLQQRATLRAARRREGLRERLDCALPLKVDLSALCIDDDGVAREVRAVLVRGGLPKVAADEADACASSELLDLEAEGVDVLGHPTERQPREEPKGGGGSERGTYHISLT